MRKVTEEERKALMEHPELVMFHAGDNKRDFAGGIKMILIPVMIVVLGPVLLCFTPFADSHPDLTVILSIMWVIVVICAAVPVIMHYTGWRTDKDNGAYNINILRKELPEELVCNVVTIRYVVPQQCEGAYIEDDEEKLFGYSGYKNFIALIPDSKVAVIWDKEGFFAFIKRDDATESLYSEA